jgi:hypothetical protein
MSSFWTRSFQPDGLWGQRAHDVGFTMRQDAPLVLTGNSTRARRRIAVKTREPPRSDDVRGAVRV